MGRLPKMGEKGERGGGGFILKLGVLTPLITMGIFKISWGSKGVLYGSWRQSLENFWYFYYVHVGNIKIVQRKLSEIAK